MSPLLPAYYYVRVLKLMHVDAAKEVVSTPPETCRLRLIERRGEDEMAGKRTDPLTDETGSLFECRSSRRGAHTGSGVSCPEVHLVTFANGRSGHIFAKRIKRVGPVLEVDGQFRWERFAQATNGPTNYADPLTGEVRIPWPLKEIPRKATGKLVPLNRDICLG